jgi:glycerol-3-phosphate dehydrogenase
MISISDTTARLSSTRAPFGKIASSSSDSKLESLLDAVSDAGLEHAAITPIVRLAAIEIDAPITEAVYHVLHRGRPLADAVERLVTRASKDELAGIR